MMKPEQEALDRLVRDAAGPLPDPGLSRRAIRASLAGHLARRQRREARARIGRTLGLAAVLAVALVGQLGSDDFNITVNNRTRAGKDWKVYRQGLRGEEVWVRDGAGTPRLSEENAVQILEQRASRSGVLVGLSGWQIGSRRHLFFIYEYVIDGKFVAESGPVPGYPAKLPKWLKDYAGPDPTAFFEATASWDDHAPDLTIPMYSGGLNWTVHGWKFRLPGRTEDAVYFRGERNDGIRTKDPEGF